MATADIQKPVCPVCKRADKVKRLQEAFNAGVARFAPPPMPAKKVSMMFYVVPGMFLTGLCIFGILVFVGSESFGQDFSWPELVLVSISIACIVLALVLSYIAFTKVVKGDTEASKHYSEWDQSLATWGRLRYCARDEVVFDPQSNKTLSDKELTALLSVETSEPQIGSVSTAH